MNCNHSMDRWSVTSTEMVTTERGGGRWALPMSWYCLDCGQRFFRIEKCPECSTSMEVIGYNDLFSTRFRCPKDGLFFSRQDLTPVSKVKLAKATNYWWEKYRNRVYYAAFLISADVFGGIIVAACLGVNLNAHVLLCYAWFASVLMMMVFWSLSHSKQSVR